MIVGGRGGIGHLSQGRGGIGDLSQGWGGIGDFSEGRCCHRQFSDGRDGGHSQGGLLHYGGSRLLNDSIESVQFVGGVGHLIQLQIQDIGNEAG